MDVVVSTFAVAWRRIDDVAHGEAELSWLYAVAYRMIANQRRSTDRFGALTNKLATTERQAAPDPVVRWPVTRSMNASSTGDLGDLPIYVLQSQYMADLFDSAWQEDLATLSTDTRYKLVGDSIGIKRLRTGRD